MKKRVRNILKNKKSIESSDVMNSEVENRVDSTQTEVEIKYDGLEFRAIGIQAPYVVEIMNILTKLKEENAPKEQTYEKVDNTNKTTNVDKATTTNSDREMPLSINMDNVKANVRLPRTSSNFRCPSCGQGFVTKVSKGSTHMWLFRNVIQETPTTVEVQIADLIINNPKDKDELIKIYKGLNELTGKPVVLVYKDGESCYCPCCKNTNTLKDWMDAHSSSANYFGTDVLCDICGSDARIITTEQSSCVECDDGCLSKIKDNKIKETVKSNT